MIRVLITGAAGYIGRLLGAKLQQAAVYVVGIDRAIPKAASVSFPVQQLDIRDPSLATVMAQHSITHVVHLASIVSPGGNEKREYDIDVNGTHNVINACLEAKVQHLTVTSSGAAYGYHADNPRWIKESDPLRGNKEFSYSRHKRAVEELLAHYRKGHPELKQLILRPGTVLGAETNNMITELFSRPRMLAIRGSSSPFVFIWDQDLVAILLQGVLSSQQGCFNVAGDGAVTVSELAAIMHKPVQQVPAWLLRSLLWLTHSLKLTKVGPNHVLFLRYRPVLANTALKETFGYTPTKTSREVFELFWRGQHNG
ncbi:SDR family oxidoreductase [Aliidiomarina quisquiliarum]|uniref:SDR family oxidoreductase n=1 Tax=Aliidiomarina quisquiliarum TaxID=2938947 RepID=UPI00208F8C52|nr:SDR family oxidoreductase [Aliidiomarina quisquiliarum]MCO4322526.1 SDR family oxidoreductase [Aliidiomarina quisquiliarum]